MKRKLTGIVGAAIGLLLTSMAVPAFAQVDLAGQWTALNQQDNIERVPGSDLGDYTGLPMNDAARAVALSYSSAMLAMPERNCQDYTENYLSFAPHNIAIERADDPVTGELVAWKISAGGSDRAPMTIWMDGRPHPPESAPRSFSGFTTGEVEGGMVTAHMTHMKRGILRRNGPPLSDQATMTLHFIRHGDLLELITITEDPIYLEAPLVRATGYRQNPRGNTPMVNPTCFPFTELPGLDKPGTVPHFLPGTNPDAQTFANAYHLPLEAAYGGAQTIYPEYRKRLKDSYTIPPVCTRYCCTGANVQGGGLTCTAGDAPPVLPPAR